MNLGLGEVGIRGWVVGILFILSLGGGGVGYLYESDFVIYILYQYIILLHKLVFVYLF